MFVINNNNESKSKKKEKEKRLICGTVWNKLTFALEVIEVDSQFAYASTQKKEEAERGNNTVKGDACVQITVGRWALLQAGNDKLSVDVDTHGGCVRVCVTELL